MSRKPEAQVQKQRRNDELRARHSPKLEALGAGRRGLEVTLSPLGPTTPRLALLPRQGSAVTPTSTHSPSLQQVPSEPAAAPFLPLGVPAPLSPDTPSTSLPQKVGRERGARTARAKAAVTVTGHSRFSELSPCRRKLPAWFLAGFNSPSPLVRRGTGCTLLKALALP